MSLGCKRIILALFALLLLPLLSLAQFSLQWQKPLALSDNKEVKDITSVSLVDSFHFISYIVSFSGKDFPGVSVFAPDESLRNITDFSVNKGLDGYRIVGFVKSGKDTISAFCNDYQPAAGSALPSLPSEMRFTFKQGKLEFLSYYPLNLSNTEHVTKMEIKDVVQAEGNTFFIAIYVQKGEDDFINIIKMGSRKGSTLRTIEKATNARLWWGNDKELVVSSETPFAKGSQKHYYEIQMLDQDLKTVRKYPSTLQYLDSNATDQLVNISYRPAYHLGMVARQVQDTKGKNRLNWYAFNGFPNGTYNKIIGENKDLLIGANTVHPAGEKVIYNYAWPGSNQNNWVISQERNAVRPHDNLIFSIETFGGLELARDTFGKATLDMLGKIKDHPEMLKDVGSTDIDRRYATVKCFDRPGETAIYIIRNRPKKLLDFAGITLSKFRLNTSDERLADNYLSTKYKREIHYNNKNLPADDNRKWLLIDIAPDDPLYTQRNELMNKEMKLETALSPIENTWYWSGDIKIGKKKYHLTKAVIGH